MTLRHLLLVSCVIAIWGFNILMIKVGVQEIPPLLLTGLRFVAVSLLLLVDRQPAGGGILFVDDLNVVFVILGTVCHYERLSAALPANVVVLGAVEESAKWMAFAAADIGLNPMEHGSGTNIKLLEYAAAGLVVVSTRFGARGRAAPGQAPERSPCHPLFLRRPGCIAPRNTRLP